jgi:excisionase family DNA binding protein
MEPLLSSKREAARVLGISIRTLETLIALGELKSVCIRRRRMIPTAELVRFARRDHALPAHNTHGAAEVGARK